MTIQVVYLVVKASREMRLAKKPRIGPDEVAIKLRLNFPDTWGKVISEVDVELPDFISTQVEAEADNMEGEQP